MRFLSAGALWWLLLAAPIIFFYLLKLKRRRRVVPSMFLWQRALDSLEANAPFRRLRRSLLLLLQLLALAAIVLALARPLVTTRALASGNTIIVIDSTASMSARDADGQTRLDRAKELAREMVAGLEGGDRAAVIESSSRVTVRSPLTSDRAALDTAIGDIRETDAAGNLADALLLAEQLARAERDAGIIIIGDGGGSPLSLDVSTPRPSAEAPARNASLRLVRVGNRADNVGVVALNSRPARGSNRQEVFASIASFSGRARSVAVEFRVDGNLVDAHAVNVEANGRSALIFDALPAAGGLAELRLDVDDDLAVDNVAYTFLPDARRLRVAVIGENPFLQQALAVNPEIEARKIISSAAPLQEFDCIVSEGALAPEALASNRPLLAINPSDVAGLWQTTGQRERPDITSVDRSHPVNSYLSYGDLHIEAMTQRNAAPWLKPVVSSGGDPLIRAGDDGRRVVMVAFDLAKSDLPLKVEFPILLANSVAWLTGRDLAAADRAVRAGQPVTLRGLSTEAAITTPAGDTNEIAPREGATVFADTMRVGVYGVKNAPSFAVSLLSEAESDTTPRDSIRTRAGEVTGQAETFQTEREAWTWIALAALAVLAAEWWIYHKRIG